jgi:hypothetical protein
MINVLKATETYLSLEINFKQTTAFVLFLTKRLDGKANTLDNQQPTTH